MPLKKSGIPETLMPLVCWVPHAGEQTLFGFGIFEQRALPLFRLAFVGVFPPLLLFFTNKSINKYPIRWLTIAGVNKKNIFIVKPLMMNIRSAILSGLTLCAIVGVFLLPPIPQDPLFHKFADARTVFSIPNFYNVISNLPFLVLGIIGLYTFFRNNKLSPSSLAILTLFVGVTGIGLGSAYYHWHPSNATLLWDRIPMTVTFMSFFVIVIGNYVGERWNFILLLSLLVIGVLSVITWYYSELNGHGDLRLYVLVQFFPMLAIPLMIFMYPTPRIIRLEITAAVILYAIAKFFEDKDAAIFNSGSILSGHTIKHLFAAAAVFFILQVVKRRTLNAPATLS